MAIDRLPQLIVYQKHLSRRWWEGRVVEACMVGPEAPKSIHGVGNKVGDEV